MKPSLLRLALAGGVLPPASSSIVAAVAAAAGQQETGERGGEQRSEAEVRQGRLLARHGACVPPIGVAR
jgi:hypothetical protein